ncbi:MAG TPA: hypothetical protein VFG41_04840 [Sphingomicrobium sp.]|jgi:hypothetical protein|nr:hypothetical protein [Sphingomicrobium sp.]
MARLIAYYLLLFVACGYALWRGKVDARIVAATFLIGNYATIALRSHPDGGYSSLESGIFAVDVACLLAFTYAALISDRFWPLWVSGLQLTTSLGHVLKLIDSSLLPLAYATALRFWGYPILIILAVGTWRGRRKVSAERGPTAAT